MNSIAPQHTHTNSLDVGINSQAQVDSTLSPTANLQAATPTTTNSPTATTAQTLAEPPAHIEQTATANLQAATPTNFSSTENTTAYSPTGPTPQTLAAPPAHLEQTPTANLQAATPAQTLAAPAVHIEQTPVTAETFIQTLAKVVATAPNDAQALTTEGQQSLRHSFDILLANNKANILNRLGNRQIAELKNQIQIPEALDKLINGILNNPQLQQELQGGTRAQEFKEAMVNYLANHLTQNQINQAVTESSLSNNDTAKAWLKQFFEQVNVKAEQPALFFSIANQVSKLKPIATALVEEFQQILANTENSMPQKTTIDVRPGVDTLSAIQQQSEHDKQSAAQVGEAILKQSVSLGELMQKTVTQHLPSISKLISTVTSFFQNLTKKSS